MNNHARADIAFRVHFHPGDGHANRVRDEVGKNKQLANYRNLDAVGPASEAVGDYRESSHFYQRRDSMTEQGLVLWTHAVSHAFPAKISTNHFKHCQSFVLIIRDTRAPEGVLQPWPIPRRCNRS